MPVKASNTAGIYSNDPNRIFTQFRYRVEMVYVDIAKSKETDIVNECLRYLIIDHNFEQNTMPILFAGLRLDKAMLDDMILNTNTNYMIVRIYKYDDLTDEKLEIKVVEDRFTYFIPDDVNKNDPIDYTEENEDEHKDQTFQEVQLGLMSISMINKNKRLLELNVTKNTIYDCVKYCLSEMDNLIIEPFSFNEVLDRIIMPAQDSVNKALRFLNNFRVFYYTPYRFYQDFEFTYLISSTGYPTVRDNEKYTSILIEVFDIDEVAINNIGSMINLAKGIIEVPVSYVNTTLYDNTIANKSKTKIKGVTSTGSSIKDLINTADYSKAKTSQIRLNNDNTNMIYNLEAEINSNNIFFHLSKNDLDMDTFTINKRFTIKHIDRYQEHNGDYLMTRKRELLMREDDTFTSVTFVNLKKIERSSDVMTTPFSISWENI